jgi:acyl-CoA reductase-like NAD-dependent aldehyde dehydrogenase
MNDSPYGLTASIWTNVIANPGSEDAFLKIADALETGTVFLNRSVLHLPRIITVLTKVRIQM